METTWMSHLLVNRKPILIGTVGTVCLMILVLSLTGTKPQSAEAQTPSASRVRDLLPRGALDDAGDQLARIASHVKTAVVHIESRRDGRSGGTVEETGSGVLMRSARTSNIFVVTNRHVILGASPRRIQIKLQDGRVINPEKVIEDAPTDVAVLLLAETDLGSAAWGDSDNLDIGHMVLAMGSPFGLSQSVTLGIISAKGRRSLILGEKGQDVINQDFLQTDAAINPGNSGGPLIDLQDGSSASTQPSPLRAAATKGLASVSPATCAATWSNSCWSMAGSSGPFWGFASMKSSMFPLPNACV